MQKKKNLGGGGLGVHVAEICLLCGIFDFFKIHAHLIL
jgi:hypothetical protein